MREADNIRDVAQLGIDWLGLDFRPGSPRFVRQVSSRAGIIPDYGCFGKILKPGEEQGALCGKVRMCGVFADDMPQNIITRVVNYSLDMVQLNGSESGVMIDNLRRTLDPDIRPGILIVKTLPLSSEADLAKCREYTGHADYFLFEVKASATLDSREAADWRLLEAYEGDVPFLLGGSIGPEDAETIRSLSHPRFVGVDVNAGFEVGPAVKNLETLVPFVQALRKQPAY